VTWKRTAGQGHRPQDLDLPKFVTRQRYVHFGRFPSGLGYIQIESFNAREVIDQEFERALEALRDTSALILDIRNNAGGFGHPRISGRFFKKPTRAGFSYMKKGAGHTDLERREMVIAPSGKWQYTHPVALLINDVTGSASDLFTTELRAAPQVITLGTTTHGNLSGVATYAVLPCGLVVRISNGYITDRKDHPIEMYGNVPDMVVEPTLQEYLRGKDPVLERAVDVLTKKLREGYHETHLPGAYHMAGNSSQTGDCSIPNFWVHSRSCRRKRAATALDKASFSLRVFSNALST
jgi:C-terminal processing protease CtpA/Prc